jgi:hypothetical protein
MKYQMLKPSITYYEQKKRDLSWRLDSYKFPVTENQLKEMQRTLEDSETSAVSRILETNHASGTKYKFNRDLKISETELNKLPSDIRDDVEKLTAYAYLRGTGRIISHDEDGNRTIHA